MSSNSCNYAILEFFRLILALVTVGYYSNSVHEIRAFPDIQRISPGNPGRPFGPSDVMVYLYIVGCVSHCALNN